MKVPKNLIAVFLAFVIVLAPLTAFCYYTYIYLPRWEFALDKKAVLAHIRDFQTIADLAREYADTAEKAHVNNIGMGCRNKTPYLYFNGGYLNLSKEESASLDTIMNLREDPSFETIYFGPGRIAFSVNNGQYALVYSYTDARPTYVNRPDEKPGCYVRKICPHWYNVVLDPG